LLTIPLPCRTHKALVDTDFITGRKIINHYEIIDELGRGVHGKVKLARNLETGENVAIKIIPRFSKKRRLGKVMALSTQDKSKREIAILKKIRHPNVVALLEVIDDPELKKIYMILEHVELGEIVWRKKGLPLICANERRRIEREMRGEEPTPEETLYEQTLERRQALKDAKRERISQHHTPQAQFWSLEYAADDEEFDLQYGSLGSMSQPPALRSKTSSMAGSRATSRAPSRNHSYRSLSRAGTPHPSEPDSASVRTDDESQTPSAARPNPVSSMGLDASVLGGYEEALFRGRSPSMADSIISHMSSVDYNRLPDVYADDFSYVPCFTIEKARSTFRDTVLGLEYLHYEGVVHRDIKPANLLWTREHRVKISDFGVSYFGRPIRDGEPDDTLSESEAKDFDNDLELAKTVGTPAFFAPELCYTDNLDAQPGQGQPKITEQIDVWSLGVTLYCLIYARIPFLAEDEWQMFRKIATEEVYIPTRRLRPVDPTTKPSEKSLHTRYNRPPYRSDHELVYEDIEPELVDLLRRMLTKQPDKRIRLRDVKRHPWVIKGIPDVIAWLDDTDPSRRTSGKKIQVDYQEMEHAVVPLTLLERARSAVKKAVDKVMHPRGDRVEGSSRKRATSSAASSGGDSPVTNPSTPFIKEHRRRSLRADRRAEDYFAGSRSQHFQSEHPLTHSVAASPDQSPADASTSSVILDSDAQPVHVERDVGPAEEALMSATSTMAGNSRFGSQKPLPPLPRHVHNRSTSSVVPGLYESRTVPPTPLCDGPPGSNEDLSTALRKARDMRPATDDSSRARSVDRGLFASNDKRAEPRVSLSTAVAPGSVQLPVRPHILRPGDTSSLLSKRMLACSSPLSTGASGMSSGQQEETQSVLSMPTTPDQQSQAMTVGSAGDQGVTGQRLHGLPEAQTPPPRVYNSSTPESFARAQEMMNLRHIRDFEHQQRERASTGSASDLAPAQIPCPPSPDDEMAARSRPSGRSRQNTIATASSSTSTSLANLSTPLTSPSELASPVTIANPVPERNQNAELVLTFRSDPSLPALLSSTSSMSGDAEGDFLGVPGTVSTSSVLETTDSLTPPALAKGTMASFPLETPEQLLEDGTVAVALGDPVVAPRAAAAVRVPVRLQPRPGMVHTDEINDDDDDESDSDEGLTMAKSTRNKHTKELSRSPVVVRPRRRGTNGSVKSTDTAKKMVVQNDATSSPAEPVAQS
jgi:[calcium/calmodulin-dependent protein kinase] kinase